MAYQPETQEPPEIQRRSPSGGSLQSGGFAPEDKGIMEDVALLTGPGPAAYESLPKFVGLEERNNPGTQEKAVASPKELGAMWDEANKKGDFSTVNAEMAKAVSAAYGSGGVDGINAVKELRRQVHDNIKTEGAKPVLYLTNQGIEIHNLKELPKADAETFANMSQELRETLGIKYDREMGWVKQLGPVQIVKIDEKPQAESKAGLEPGSRVTVKLTDKAQMFRADDGSAIVYRDDFSVRDGDVLYSKDGKTFHEVGMDNYGGSIVDHKFGFVDPAVDRNKEFKVSRKDDAVTVDGKVFRRVERPDLIEATTIPEVRTGLLVKLPEADGRLLYYSVSKCYSHINDRQEAKAQNEAQKKMSEQEFIESTTKMSTRPFAGDKVYIGKPGEMKEVKIQNNVMFLNSKHYLVTSEGTLETPAYNEPNKQTTWTPNGGSAMPVTDQKSEDYQITENKKGLTLLPKR